MLSARTRPLSRNLAFTHFYSFSKLNIPALHETDGKFRVLENSKLNPVKIFCSINYIQTPLLTVADRIPNKRRPFSRHLYHNS